MKLLYVTQGFYPVCNATKLCELNIYEALKLRHDVDNYVLATDIVPKSLINKFSPVGISYITNNKKDFPKLVGAGLSIVKGYNSKYSMKDADELYELINTGKYDCIVTSHFILDKSRFNVPMIVFNHDNMPAMISEIYDGDNKEELMTKCKEYELKKVSQADKLLVFSNMDYEYFKQGDNINVSYIPQVISYSEDNLEYLLNTENTLASTDLFYAGHPSWFRTYKCIDNILDDIDNTDVSLKLYISGLRALHRVPKYDETTTELITDKNLPEDVHNDMKYSIIPYEYKSGFPTKLNIGLGNGMLILVKGPVTRYLPPNEAVLCKDLVKSYNSKEELLQHINNFKYEDKVKAIEFVKKYRSPEYVGDLINNAIEEVCSNE